MNAPYAKERQVAIEAVLKACFIASKMQGTLQALDVVNKEDLSPVTVTDFSCQAIINMTLSEHFPSDGIMGEEDSLLLRSPQSQMIRTKVFEQIEQFFPECGEEEILDAIDLGGHPGGRVGRFWTIDPIDGTKGFIRNDQYAVAMALIENGEVVLGLLGCPRLHAAGPKGSLFVAVKGQGAVMIPIDTPESEIKIHVSGARTPDNVIYCEPQLTSQSHSHEKALKIAQILHANPQPFRLDSQCRYALVSHGDASIYLRLPSAKTYVEKIWDHAAGLIIVEEAGGKVTDVHGLPLDFSHGKSLSKNRGVIATNGHLHEKVLGAVKQVL